MQNAALKARAKKPPLQIGESDYDILSALAIQIERRLPDLSEQLFDELDRANVVADKKLRPDVVRIGSLIEYSDGSPGSPRKVRLVLPGEADIEQAKVSVLTPIGAGLIGLREGQEIDWPCPDGRARKLTILSVAQP